MSGPAGNERAREAWSPLIDRRARKNYARALRALAAIGQRQVADLMGVHESNVSRWKDGPIENACAFLAACGLKVVSEDSPTVERVHLDGLNAAVQRVLRDAGEPSVFGDLYEAQPSGGAASGGGPA